ncbi:non-ribosomal peptide synthetase [Roseobacter sp. S98]|uniref:non-ribosomal peptide synthetase n=1 Tax=Roseobacter algicola (ex Choi et al. 2025) (nom. illeg.) TaxID=3092138 RepID=UPI003F515A3A
MTLPAGVTAVLPLTPAQKGMLFHVLEDPAAQGRYVAVLSCTIDGPLDPQRLKTAMQQAVTARDSYRAGFVWEGMKQPAQAIRETITLPWEEDDWSGKSGDAAQTDLAALIRLEQSRRFDLGKPPLMAVRLIRRTETEHVLVWTVHHLISDGWSTSVVLDDIFRRYAGEATPDRAPASFRDVLGWVRKNRQDVADRDYWGTHLAGLDDPATLPLAPLARPGAGQDHREMLLGADTARAVCETSKKLRITPNSLLSAAWALTLRHLTGSNDVIFGQTYAGRPPEVPGSATAAGAFINTLPLRLRIDPETTVAEFLRHTETHQRAHTPHAFAALTGVQAIAPVPRGTPLFETLFVNEPVATLPDARAGVTIRDLRTVQSSNYTLAMLVTPGDDLRCELYLDTSKVSPDLADGILLRYRMIVTALTADPRRTLTDALHKALPMPRVTETQPYPTVLERFLKAAENTPDAPAVSDAHETLTYSQLRSRAGAIATALRRAGTRPGEIIPVALPRETDALAAFIGTWMAGAAYVPLDLTYPAARIADILETVDPARIITRGDTIDTLPAHGADLILTDRLTGDDAPTVTPGPLAYVIFTSGSQGKPKGVVISHNALAHSTGVRDEIYGGTPDAYLVLSSLAFDSSVPGLCWPLATGGHVVLAPKHAEQDPDGLGTLIDRHSVTHTLCLPGLAAALLDALPDRTLRRLRTLICAGEALPQQLVDRVGQAAPGLRLFNEYGPTETTVWATAAEVTGSTTDTVPIGRALPGTWAGICDPDGIPLPPGVRGGIAVCGPTLAEGYFNAPALTEETFAAAGTGAPRLYRTGDSGYADAAGTITWTGRSDRQVKIRGHRVEPGETEAAAQALCPGATCLALPVDGTIVLCIETPPGRAEAEEIMAQLAARLPAPFVPARVILMDQFPRLPNGKTDVGALTEMAAVRPVAVAVPPPMTALEQQIADIFASAFGTDSFDPDADFFDEGGDSLMTIAVYSMARQRGLTFAPVDIFEHPTPRALARRVLATADTRVDSQQVRNVCYANTGGDRDAVFIVHGTMQLFSQVARGLGDRHPVGLLFSHYLHGLRVPLTIRVEDLAQEAVENLRALKPAGPYVLCAYSAGAPVALEMARILGDELKHLVLIDPPYQMLQDGPPPDTEPAALRLYRRTRRALALRLLRHTARVAALTVLAPVMPRSDWRRRALVRSAYVFSLSRYRIRQYDRPVTVMISQENPALAAGSAIDTRLKHRSVINLQHRHRDVLTAPESVVAVATSIISLMRKPS